MSQPLTVRGLRRLMAMLPPSDDEMQVLIEFDYRCGHDVAMEASVEPNPNGGHWFRVSSGDIADE